MIALTCRDTKPQDKAEFYNRNTKPKYNKMRFQAEIYLAALQSRNLLPQYKTEIYSCDKKTIINCRDMKPKLIAAIQNRNIKLGFMAAIQSRNIKRCDAKPKYI